MIAAACRLMNFEEYEQSMRPAMDWRDERRTR